MVEISFSSSMIFFFLYMLWGITYKFLELLYALSKLNTLINIECGRHENKPLRFLAAGSIITCPHNCCVLKFITVFMWKPLISWSPVSQRPTWQRYKSNLFLEDMGLRWQGALTQRHSHIYHTFMRTVPL